MGRWRRLLGVKKTQVDPYALVSRRDAGLESVIMASLSGARARQHRGCRSPKRVRCATRRCWLVCTSSPTRWPCCLCRCTRGFRGGRSALLDIRSTPSCRNSPTPSIRRQRQPGCGLFWNYEIYQRDTGWCNHAGMERVHHRLRRHTSGMGTAAEARRRGGASGRVQGQCGAGTLLPARERRTERGDGTECPLVSARRVKWK